MEIDKLTFEIGSDILYSSEIHIHQPSIKELCEVCGGEKNFYKTLITVYSTIVDKITIEKNEKLTEEQKAFFLKLNSFEYLLGLISLDIKYYLHLIMLFKVFFPEYECELKTDEENKGYLCLTNEKAEKTFSINEKNYKDIIILITKICCLNTSETEQQEYNPANEAARRIMEKLQAGKKKVQELKNKEEDKKNSGYFLAKMINLLRGSGSFRNNELIDMTIYQLKETFTRYNMFNGRKEQVTLRAGGFDVKEFIDWTKED